MEDVKPGILVRDWFNDGLIFGEEDALEINEKLLFPQRINTQSFNVFVRLPNTEKTEVQNRKYICFWDIITKYSRSNKDFFDNISNQFKSVFKVSQGVSVHLVDENIEENKLNYIYNTLDFRNKSLYYFFSPDFMETSFLENYSSFNVDVCRTLIDNCASNSVFVFDCKVDSKLIESLEKSGRELFVFCSNFDSSNIPEGEGLPNDIFTSCMTSAPRFAILMHSRTYSAYDSQIIERLEYDYVENSEYIDRVHTAFNTVSIYIIHVVEAIAFDLLDEETFVKFFRTDNVVRYMTVNFIYACKVLSNYQIYPQSFPRIPCFNTHHLWDTLDFLIGMSLFKISPNDPDFQLESSILQSFETSVSTITNLSDNFFSYELAFVPTLLLSESNRIVRSACSVLARYLFINTITIRMAIHFRCLHCVARCFIDLPAIECATCLLKFAAFSPTKCFSCLHNFLQVKEYKLSNFFGKLLNLFSESCVYVALGYLLLSGSNENAIRLFYDHMKDMDFLDLFGNRSSSSFIWSFFLLSLLYKFMNDPLKQKVLLYIENCVQICKSEVRFAAIEFLEVFIKDGKDDKIKNTIKALSTDMSDKVRICILRFAQCYSDEEFMNKLSEDIYSSVQVDLSKLEYIKKMRISDLYRNIILKVDSRSLMSTNELTCLVEAKKISFDSATAQPIATKLRYTRGGILSFGSVDGSVYMMNDSSRFNAVKCFNNERVGAHDILYNNNDYFVAALNCNRIFKLVSHDGNSRTCYHIPSNKFSGDNHSLSLQQSSASMAFYSGKEIQIYDLNLLKNTQNLTFQPINICKFSSVYHSILTVCCNTSIYVRDLRQGGGNIADISFDLRVIGAECSSGILTATEDGCISAIDLRNTSSKICIRKPSGRTYKFFEAGNDAYALASTTHYEVYSATETLNQSNIVVKDIACGVDGCYFSYLSDGNKIITI